MLFNIKATSDTVCSFLMKMCLIKIMLKNDIFIVLLEKFVKLNQHVLRFEQNSNSHIKNKVVNMLNPSLMFNKGFGGSHHCRYCMTR